MVVGNWEDDWAKRFDEREAMYTGESGLNYWEARAADFSELRVSQDYGYGRKVAEMLAPLISDQAEVLDVGAGPGTLLVPFGPRVGRFTAVEPAANMVALLEKNAREAGVDHYRVWQSTWQDVDVARYGDQFDLVMISITLWMFRDIWPQIQRMEQVCRGHCAVITGSGRRDTYGEGSTLWKGLFGDAPRPDYSEFPFIFNLLYDKGRLPEVRYFSHAAQRSVETRIRQQQLFYAKYAPLTPEQDALIRAHVEKSAVNGMVQEDYSCAVVWWKPGA